MILIGLYAVSIKTVGRGDFHGRDLRVFRGRMMDAKADRIYGENLKRIVVKEVLRFVYCSIVEVLNVEILRLTLALKMSFQ